MPTTRVSPPTIPDLAERPRLHNSWTPDETPRDWQYIVLHHTATNHGDVDSIDQSHRKNKDKNGNPWMGIGYHFVIGNGDGMSDGEIAPTFRWQRQLAGAHAGRLDYNDRGIGICLVGNFEKTPPTTAQVDAAGRLVSELAATYGIASDSVIGHSDVKATECPGRLFPLADVQSRVAALRSPAAEPWQASLGPIGKDPSRP